jgi:prepilin-type N-terminal cleavage/methylation domain-containing protein
MMIRHPFYQVCKFSIRHQIGVTLTEVMIAVGIFAILAALATPNIKKQMQTYKLKSASTDLVSFIQKAKSQSAKDNVELTIDFNPDGYTGYEIKDMTSDPIRVITRVNFGKCDNSSEKLFSRCYGSDVSYKSPPGAEEDSYDNVTITFKPNGLTTGGYVCLTNNDNSRYYRVSLLSASGIIRTERWNEDRWE